MASICVQNPILGQELINRGFVPEHGPLSRLQRRRRFHAPLGMSRAQADSLLNRLVSASVVGVEPRGCGCCWTPVFSFRAERLRAV